MTASLEVQLAVALPAEWELIPERAWDALNKVPHISAAARVASVVAGLPSDGPDLVAGMFSPEYDESGELVLIRMASLVCLILGTVALPSDAQDLLAGHIERGVEVSDGIAADFHVIAHQVSGVAGCSALLVFATPNLPMIPEMDELFAQIARGTTLTAASSTEAPARAQV